MDGFPSLLWILHTQSLVLVSIPLLGVLILQELTSGKYNILLRLLMMTYTTNVAHSQLGSPLGGPRSRVVIFESRFTMIAKDTIYHTVMG